MAQFEDALAYLLTKEDYTPPRYEPVTDNNGGTVIAGINSKSFPDDVATILDCANRAEAVKGFYLRVFWKPMLLGGIESQDVANRVLDMGVNAGMGRGIRLLQQAINALGHNIAEDGVIGPVTIGTANTCDPDSLLASYRAQRVAYYNAIAAKNPDNLKYLAGWLKRANA